MANLKRRQVYVKKTFQRGLIAKFILLVLLGSIISSLIMYYIASKDLSASYFSAHQNIKNTWDLLLPSLFLSNLISIVLISAATIYVTLYISHKIAGPLYKIEKLMKQIGDGDLTVDCTLRGGDELTDISESMQIMVLKLKEKIVAKEFDAFKTG